MALEYKDKRVCTRTCLAVPLVFTYFGLEADKPNKHITGTTCDLSKSGISFFTNLHLSEDVGIEILSIACHDEKRAGTVRWCKTLAHNYYLVGVALQ